MLVWGAWHESVFAIGFTDSDHFHPGWKVPLPKVTPPIVTSSTLPLGKVRVSSGVLILFFSIALIFASPILKSINIIYNDYKLGDKDTSAGRILYFGTQFPPFTSKRGAGGR
jgi:hypothetical protein